jgi:hypothetical protein
LPLAILFYAFCVKAAEVDARLHADVIRLLETDGTKQYWQKNLKKVVDQGRAEVIQSCPDCAPAFVDEWGKRMRARIHAGDFTDIFARVYEKYFSDEEVMALTRMMKSRSGAGLPPAVKHRVDSVMPSVQSEIGGGIVQLSSKIGYEVALEIKKEHPEYLRSR